MATNEIKSAAEVIVRPYQYSVKLEMNAKGLIQPSVHAYGDVPVDTADDCIETLHYVITEARKRGYKMACDITETPKNDKKE